MGLCGERIVLLELWASCIPYTIFAKEELVYYYISLMNEEGVLIVYLSQLSVTQEVIQQKCGL